jgi:hypothetical protein
MKPASSINGRADTLSGIQNVAGVEIKAPSVRGYV